MNHRDHVALLRDGIERPGGTWADVGAGTGAFTLALADLLGPGARILAVDRDAGALRDNARHVAATFPAVRLETIVADFAGDLELPVVDGFVAANSLHYVAPARQPEVIRRLAEHLRPGGTVIVVEYDADRGNPWIPHPWSAGRWPALAEAAGLVDPRFLHRVPSRMLGAIYAASARRASASTSTSTSAGST